MRILRRGGYYNFWSVYEELLKLNLLDMPINWLPKARISLQEYFQHDCWKRLGSHNPSFDWRTLHSNFKYFNTNLTIQNTFLLSQNMHLTLYLIFVTLVIGVGWNGLQWSEFKFFLMRGQELYEFHLMLCATQLLVFVEKKDSPKYICNIHNDSVAVIILKKQNCKHTRRWIFLLARYKSAD